MNEQETQELSSMITALYLTRGQNITPQIVQAWGAFLTSYDISKVKRAFNSYIKYGDNFPSLPSVIALIENRVDSDTASIDAWSSVRKAMKVSSSKGLSKAEKEVMNRIAPNGLSELLTCDVYSLSQHERDFKKMFKAGYDGVSKEILIEPTGDIKFLQVEHKPMIDNGGLFKNEI